MGLINRWYKLLNLLITKKTVTLNTIEEHLQLSTRTVKLTINLLNEELGSTADIIESNNSYKLIINQHEPFEKILHGSLKLNTDFNSATKRRAYIIRYLLREDQFVYIDDLAENLEVSRGTVNGDLKAVRELASNYHITITSVPNRGIRIVGDEFYLRLFEIYHSAAFFEYHVISEQDIEFIIALQEKYHFRKQDIYLLLRAIDVSMFRIQKGFRMGVIAD